MLHGELSDRDAGWLEIKWKNIHEHSANYGRTKTTLVWTLGNNRLERRDKQQEPAATKTGI